MSAANRIEHKAAEWLLRREHPDWCEQDGVALEAWREASPAHDVAFLRLEHGWEKVGRLAALRPMTPRRSAPRWSRAWRPVAAAATIAIAVAGGASLTGLDGRFATHRFGTVVGGHQIVPLADGSKVELNTDTRLRAQVTAHSREVWLDRGEAFFEVARDQSRPFVVWAGSRKIVVVGTKFSVRRDGDKVRVGVLEGRVRVEPRATGRYEAPQIVNGGDIVLADGPSALVSRNTREKVAADLSWRYGQLAFDQQTLEEVVAEFNRYNATKLVLADPAVGRIRLGGVFQAENAESFARLLQSGYGLSVTVGDDEIRIGS